MDWLNIHRSTLAAEQFLGCEPTQRATWLCLLAYCADQENGGRIEGASEWGDRKWQQIVRITHGEAHDKCDLWRWEDGVLIVWAYPVEKEAEVRRNRENGKGGGRPPKPKGNQVVSSGLTETEPPAPISAETERKGKGIGKEGEGKKKERVAFTPPTEAEATEYANQIGFTEVKKWMGYYEANGWKAGKSKMVDWRGAMRYWLPKDGAAGAAPTPPTIQEWMQEGQTVAMSNTTRNGATWPRDLCSAAFYQCASQSWRGITDWRGKLRAECLRWVGNENGRAR